MEKNDTGSQMLANRLGKCEVCDVTEAIYTCPKCEVKTCSLKCSIIHKKELECDGIRNPTKYVHLKNMTEQDLQSDYNFLEDCTRYVEARKRDKIKKITHYNKLQPMRISKLQKAARERNITLRFLLQNFTRSRVNTTIYDNKSKVIKWRVEWVFTDAGSLKYVDRRCSENEKLSNLIDKYINPDSVVDVPQRNALQFYQSRGIGGIAILLKAEGTKNCKNRFYRLNANFTLNQNLTGKTIIEYPVIHLVYSDTNCFDVIDSDDDIQMEAEEHDKYFSKFNYKRQHEKVLNPEIKATEETESKQPKKRRGKRKIQENTANKSLLFSTDHHSDESSSTEAEEDAAKETPSVIGSLTGHSQADKSTAIRSDDEIWNDSSSSDSSSSES